MAHYLERHVVIRAKIKGVEREEKMAYSTLLSVVIAS